MELLHGETLRDRLADLKEQGGLPLDEVLDIAFQVSAAACRLPTSAVSFIATSSRRIFFSPAKASLRFSTSGWPRCWNPNRRPNLRTRWHRARTLIDATLSRIGFAMGTAGYMSPEQARGETARRTHGLVLVRPCAVRDGHRQTHIQRRNSRRLSATPSSIRRTAGSRIESQGPA